MNAYDIDARDRELDAPRAEAAGSDDLLAKLASITPIDWPERAAGHRIAAGLAASIATLPATQRR